MFVGALHQHGNEPFTITGGCMDQPYTGGWITIKDSDGATISVHAKSFGQLIDLGNMIAAVAMDLLVESSKHPCEADSPLVARYEKAERQ